MRRTPTHLLVTAVVTLALAASASPAVAGGDRDRPGPRADLRVATFNASLNRTAEGELLDDLSTPDDPQASAVAEIVQRTRPDLVLLNEFDFVEGGAAVDAFRENYLERPQSGARAIDYRYSFTAPVNTGVPSGRDLDKDGVVGGPGDALGFGTFPGQYGMVVLSRYPIERSHVRTFQHLLWKDVPGAVIPRDFYSAEDLAVLPLSSKSHWDVPVRVGRRTVHLLASHPTPPTFDGPEDRNGRRNHDEIRFWADYVAGGRDRWIRDDRGRRGGIDRGALYVVAGDQNADPADGDSFDGAIDQLLGSRHFVDPLPTSRGAVEAARLQGGANASHRTPARYDTADFADVPGPGNLRADYVLPSPRLRVRGAGVFWPVQADPLSRLTGTFPFPSSDHRLVWVDLRIP
ncbi:MAG: endonuclease/exonuclease/phosphatase family protein [Nocardioidaceae bacterium]|nr:endonuclease/exonuclease/phosphatase family protein [Nocardioidaceae bacterium]